MILDFVLLHMYSIRQFKVDFNLLPLLIGAILPVILSLTIAYSELGFALKSLCVAVLLTVLTASFWFYVFDEELRLRIKKITRGQN